MQFVEERLEPYPGFEEKTAAVYESYRGWCSDNGCYPENIRNFNQALRSFAVLVRKRGAISVCFPPFGATLASVLHYL